MTDADKVWLEKIVDSNGNCSTIEPGRCMCHLCPIYHICRHVPYSKDISTVLSTIALGELASLEIDKMLKRKI